MKTLKKILKLDQKEDRIRTGENVANPRFLFVRGYMRSGTNWVGNLLNLHPDVNCTGEFYLDDIYNALQQRMTGGYSIIGQPEFRSKVNDHFEKFVKECIETCCDTQNSKNKYPRWWGDRTPRDIEPVLIRGGYYFLVIRDPRDVTVSWLYHLLRLDIGDNPNDPHIIHFDRFPKLYEKREIFRKDQSFFKKNPTQLLEDNEEWVRFNFKKWGIRMRLNWEAMKKMEMGSLSGRCLLIKYEELHQNLEGQRKKMYRFLDLDPSKALPLNDRTSPGFKRENFQSHYRKGMIGDWKSYFTPTVAGWAHEELGDLLVKLDYERSGSELGLEGALSDRTHNTR